MRLLLLRLLRLCYAIKPLIPIMDDLRHWNVVGGEKVQLTAG
jgi:hypothetical protein